MLLWNPALIGMSLTGKSAKLDVVQVFQKWGLKGEKGDDYFSFDAEENQYFF